ncbi:ATP-binding protein [Pleurocapsa sp. PCC 7319]|uniref:ATP-binding protein n=1 Tax=Pleurocapsa sp. PCC 7319 TaxID=118161 RepID=UPI00130DBE3E|nr:ATP-binding protein [Pleurocapsa sp. PCC 7319]
MTNPTSELFLSFQYLNEALESYIKGETDSATVNILSTEPRAIALIGEKFRLSPFERIILLLCAAIEIEPNFPALCAQAHQDDTAGYATLGLALSAFPDADWSVLSPQNPLHYWQLIHTEPKRLLTHSPLQIDCRILCYLLGEPGRSPQLSNWLQPISVQGIDSLLPSHATLTQQIITAWSNSTSQPSLPPITLSGIDATTNQQIAVAACGNLGFQIMTLPVAVLPTNLDDLKICQRHWEREAILSNSVLLLESDLHTLSDPSKQAAIALFLEIISTPVIFSSPDSKVTLRRQAIVLEVPSLPHQEQTDLWHQHLGSTPRELNGYVDTLVTQFNLTPTAIQKICSQFRLQQDTPEDEPNLSTFKNEDKNNSSNPPQKSRKHQDRLWHLCRLQARPNLDALAQRIEARATWEELVLPDRPRQLLEDIATRLKYRSRIYQDWGFAKKGDRGLGISALFHGESGTGKTMAAEVLAQVCQLDLYRIDLSTVVSKYIGETEKNLRRIFDAAESGGVILLFDEADALFGKRTEVKDSHDRHANIEVSYLLQRIETYSGLAILTSNLKQNLDRAFLRRLQFIVSFPFPDATARTKIWQHIFPSQTPRQGLDYSKLGQLKVAGGNIRNIALTSAFLAAQTNSPISMEQIRLAAQRDYSKLEKLLTTEELQGWTEK